MNFIITPMQPEDWPAVEEIYRQGIGTGNATFETASPGWEEWNASHHPQPRLVVREEDHVVAWAAHSPVSARRVYAGVAEVSIYVGSHRSRQGDWQSVTARPH